VSGHYFNPKMTPMFRAVSKMPPCDHWPHGSGYGFDIMRSEVCQWLIAQPEARQELFNWCKRIGAITYDVETHTWRGVEWKQPQ